MNEKLLGTYLRDRRTKLDPSAVGLPEGRRRTPGLRREEVAQRANISPTWYTWLEQGRGGAASADVLDRVSRALMLAEAEREHVFLLGLGRPPEVRYRPSEAIAPRLQRVLDAFDASPAVISTATWDIVAWNRAASAVMTDYSRVAPEHRNALRMIFCNPQVRAAQDDWDGVARFAVAVFRANVARAGAAGSIDPLVDDLCRQSPEFEAMWRDNDVRAQGGGTKHIRHPAAGPIALEYSTFAVDGRPELTMLVHNPATPQDAARIRSLIAADRAA